MLQFDFSIENEDDDESFGSMILLPSILLDLVKTGGGQTDFDTEWEEWGPQSTRIIDGIQHKFISQYRTFVTLNDKTTVVDFNTFDIARDLQNGQDENIIITESSWRYCANTCGPARDCEHRLVTSLPYRCLEVDVPGPGRYGGERFEKVLGRRIFGLKCECNGVDSTTS